MLMFLNREATQYLVILYLTLILWLENYHLWHEVKLKIPWEETAEKSEIQRKIKKKKYYP